jgi:indolepyruvate decarboxylase
MFGVPGLGDGAFQMTVQELSTILRLELKPIIFLINNDGYTIERLIFGPHSSYNDLSPWHYGRIPAALDKRERAVIHSVKTETELQEHQAWRPYKLKRNEFGRTPPIPARAQD